MIALRSGDLLRTGVLTSLAISSSFFSLFLPLFFTPWGYGEYFQDVKPVQQCLSVPVGSGEDTYTPGHIPHKPNDRSSTTCLTMVPKHREKGEREGFGTIPLFTFISAGSAPRSPHEGLQGQALELDISLMYGTN